MYEKRCWGLLIIVVVLFAWLFIMTPVFTHSDAYQPIDLDLNGNTFVRLMCKSDTQFITSLSNLKCYVGVRSDWHNFSYVNMIIQAGYNDTPIWSCTTQIVDFIEVGKSPQLYRCENSFYNDTISRPATRLHVRLLEFLAKFANSSVPNPQPLKNVDGEGQRKILQFDRSIEVMSRTEELNVEISRNNLFIATLSLLVLAILEFRKFWKDKS